MHSGFLSFGIFWEVFNIKNNGLGVCQLTKKELIMLWFNNYESGESLIDITEWVKFQSIDEFAQRFIMSKEHKLGDDFYFNLNLDGNEENALRNYLLKRKSFVVKYILNGKSFSPYTHLYQLYLQYLPDQLNEIEKNVLLAGYLHMLTDIQGDNYAATKRISLEKKLNLR